MSNQLLPRYVNPSSTDARSGALLQSAATGRQKLEEFSHEETASDLYRPLRVVSDGGRSIAADDMGKSQTVNGWVSDSKCGAKGANAGAAACTKKCIEGGASAVVVTDGDNKVLAVDNADALKGHEGHHVAVTGHVKGDSIHVESVKMF